MALDEIHTSCVLEFPDNGGEVPVGVDVVALIRPMFPAQVQEAFDAQSTIELYEGARLIAVGRFLG